MKELQIIEAFYKDQKAERSRTPYINHIYEGLLVLAKINASEVAKKAYCLHPILQSDEAFCTNKSSNVLKDVDTEALILCMEYRRVANSYLSKSNKSDFVGFSCDDVKDMLIADKVQNYKDFLLFHQITHPRAKELDQYFNNWFDLLKIDYAKIVKFIYRTACVVALDYKEKYLFLDRSDKTGYCFPGGKVEFKESAVECILRELYEETNLKLNNIKKIGEYISEQEGRDTFQIIVYHSYIDNVSSLNINEESLGYKFTSINEHPPLSGRGEIGINILANFLNKGIS